MNEVQCRWKQINNDNKYLNEFMGKSKERSPVILGLVCWDHNQLIEHLNLKDLEISTIMSPCKINQKKKKYLPKGKNTGVKSITY